MTNTNTKTTREFKFESTGATFNGQPVFKIYELDRDENAWVFYGKQSFDKNSSHAEKVKQVLRAEIMAEYLAE